jgi:hypothetical protein
MSKTIIVGGGIRRAGRCRRVDPAQLAGLGTQARLRRADRLLPVRRDGYPARVGAADQFPAWARGYVRWPHEAAC